MRKPKMPKSKTLKALQKYEVRLNDFLEAKALEERLRKKSLKL